MTGSLTAAMRRTATIQPTMGAAIQALFGPPSLVVVSGVGSASVASGSVVVLLNPDVKIEGVGGGCGTDDTGSVVPTPGSGLDKAVDGMGDAAAVDHLDIGIEEDRVERIAHASAGRCRCSVRAL